MPGLAFKLFDNNTGEEVFASDDFAFTAIPAIHHTINDPDLVERYGAPAVVQKVEQGAVNNGGAVVYNVYIDGSEERLNTQDMEESYRRS